MIKTSLPFITFYTLFQAYVFWRAGAASVVRRHVSRLWLLVAFVLVWILFVTGMFGNYYGEWIVFLFMNFLFLLVVDLVSGFGFFLPRLAPRLRTGALAAALLFMATALVQGARAPVVRDYEVRLTGLPPELDRTVLVAVGDLHAGRLTSPGWLRARVDQVLALHPDMILLLGDIVEAHGGDPEHRYDGFVPALKALQAPLGVWAVLGNHEYRYMNGPMSADTLAYGQAGIPLLRNRWAQVRPGLVLAGVDFAGFQHQTGIEKENLHLALEGRPPGATILLSHAPVQADQAAQAGVGLMLSGHTHGGQVWPLGYLGRRYYYSLFEGRYEVGGMTVLVTRGAGTYAARMRLWQPGEIMRITLRCE